MTSALLELLSQLKIGCETNTYVLRLRPRLLVKGIKVWDWYWDHSLWSQQLRLILILWIGGLKTWDRDWYHPSLSLGLKTKVSLSSVGYSVQSSQTRFDAPYCFPWLSRILINLPSNKYFMQWVRTHKLFLYHIDNNLTWILRYFHSIFKSTAKGENCWVVSVQVFLIYQKELIYTLFTSKTKLLLILDSYQAMCRWKKQCYSLI